MSNRAARRRAERSGLTTNPLTVTWASNAAFCATGYGTQTKQVVSRMIRDGHHVTVAANYGLEAISSDWEGIEHLPKGFDGYSQDIISAYFKDVSAQHPNGRPYVFTLYDVWAFDNPAWEKLPVVSWVPIDHMPGPPKVLDWCARPNVTPVAMSRYGSERLTAAGIEHVLIPHGIETDVYKPTPTTVDAAGNRRTGRQLMGVPDGAHVTGICNANKGVSPVRKAFGEQLLAWAIFAKDKPDAYLYLHTEIYGGMGGIPFAPLLEAVGADPERVKWANQYQIRMGIPAEAVAAIYSGLDVLLAATLGEGFGLTVAEAAACETPSIVNDFSAQPELTVPGESWRVGGQPLWDAAHASWFNTPSIRDMVAALEESYERRGIKSPASRQHILDNYDADTIYRDLWRPFLEEVLP